MNYKDKLLEIKENEDQFAGQRGQGLDGYRSGTDSVVVSKADADRFLADFNELQTQRAVDQGMIQRLESARDTLAQLARNHENVIFQEGLQYSQAHSRRLCQCLPLLF